MKTLDNVHVLVDGYNLELKQGTGISTYGMTLIQALLHLKAHVGVLGSSWVSHDPILAEVLLFDLLRDQARRWDVSHILGILKGIMGVRLKARRVLISDVVEKIGVGKFYREFVPSVLMYSGGDCYRIANLRYMVFGRTMSVTVPQKIDIWHATSPLPVKIRAAKKITTIHDIIPLRLPHMTMEDKRNFYGNIRDAARDSELLLCVSECTKNDVLSFFDVDPEKIRVIHQPIALDTFNCTQEQVLTCLQKYNLGFKEYILYVGTIEPRKNVGGLAEAYAGVGTGKPLVIVGKKQKVWEHEASRLALIKNVSVLEYVHPNELSCLYAGALMFVFPSFYEGFGLPPLEAMTFGCPVITSNVSSLPEVCGDAALYVDPTDVQDIREKIRLLLSDSSLRNRLSYAGMERSKLFSMDRYVQKICDAYHTVLGCAGS